MLIHSEPLYPSKRDVVELNLTIPACGVAGRCAVVPVGKIIAPVFALLSIVPEIYVSFHCCVELPKSYVPVVSGRMFELISAENATVSVASPPNVKLPEIVASPETVKSPPIVT